jgi:hypothetical protein
MCCISKFVIKICQKRHESLIVMLLCFSLFGPRTPSSLGSLYLDGVKPHFLSLVGNRLPLGKTYPIIFRGFIGDPFLITMSSFTTDKQFALLGDPCVR